MAKPAACSRCRLSWLLLPSPKTIGILRSFHVHIQTCCERSVSTGDVMRARLSVTPFTEMLLKIVMGRRWSIQSRNGYPTSTFLHASCSLAWESPCIASQTLGGCSTKIPMEVPESTLRLIPRFLQQVANFLMSFQILSY